MKISIILPTYNEYQWLTDTIDRLYDALKIADNIAESELIIIDDGSTDETKQTIENVKKKHKDLRIVYLYQENGGRLIARKTGLESALYSQVLLIDSRVHIGSKSLKFVFDKVKKNKRIWNGHVIIKRGNFLSMFWDVIVRIAWSKYFKNPREVAYGIEQFDSFPKGTTCFLAPKRSLVAAIKEYERTNRSGANSNDDTAILREMIKHEDFNMSPEFLCYYHARSTLRKFTKHSLHRGKVFVDGFLSTKNRYRPMLVLFYAVHPIVLILVAIFGYKLLIYLIIAFIASLVILLPLLIIIYRIYFMDALYFILVLPLFSLFYGVGLWSGLVQFIQRRSNKGLL